MDLNQLYESLQEQILNLYEQENTDLASQLLHWRLIRRSSAVQYYARKQGLKRLGLQPVPSLASSEAAGKQAIEMTILLDSLMQSPFAQESWTLQDTSADLVLNTDPQRTFKKLPFTVEVWFDDDKDNTFPYVNYRLFYVRDENNFWYKAEGKVDYDGLYYEEPNGDRAYFKLFATDASVYSKRGFWTVHYNSHVLFPPPTSSRPLTGPSSIVVIDSDEEQPGPSKAADTVTGQTHPGPADSDQSEEESERTGRRTPGSPKAVGVRPRQGEGQREPSSPPIKRAKADSSGGFRRRGARGGGGTGGGIRRRSGGGSAPTAEEVGRGHFLVTQRGLTRLGRLQEEARDPSIIIVQGPANCLKCWRFRLSRYKEYFENSTSVFRWVTKPCDAPESRILVSFKSTTQRQQFITYVKIPKHCHYSFGSLDTL